MKTVEIKGEVRTDLGKRGSSNLRKQGMIPAVVYGGDKVYHISAPASAYKDIIYTPEFKKAAIEIEGQVIEAIVKDRQFDPLSNELTHVDFLQLIPGKMIQASLPVRLVGSSKGVREGGTLLQKVRRLPVTTLPENMPEAIEVDITTLELGKSVRVRDIKPVDGLTINQAPSIPLATIDIPRALRSAQAKSDAPAKGKK